MGAPKGLSGKDRDFLNLVNQAVFANPFSADREALDLKIAGTASASSESQRVDAMVQAVSARMQTMEEKGLMRLHQYTEPDRTLVHNALLFYFFHLYMAHFDQFIHDQVAAGETTLPVPFAREAFQWLIQRGFAQQQVGRYFELMYQLRRAYFFIDRNLIGCSPCMKELRYKLWNNVFTQDIELYHRYLWNRMEDFSTMILGETGTGKGTAAAAIGRSGLIPFDEKNGRFVESFTRTFIAINLSQFHENLIESELFGHKKGAFTGAVEDYQGIFDRCSAYGSIFLDEIGEVSIPVQIKLLHVLQEREFSPVGSHAKHRFEGRVIAATNRSINKLRRTGKMREDFFYRLCSDMITVPPLRQRIREDSRELGALLSLMVERLLGNPSPDICRMVHAVIDGQLGRNYPWPGNVRELGQCLRRVLMNQHYEGQSMEVHQSLDTQLFNGIRSGEIAVQDLISGYCYLLYRKYGTYEAVAGRTRLDRRTVKKYIDQYSPDPKP